MTPDDRPLPGFKKIFDITADLSPFSDKFKKQKSSKNEFARLDFKIKIEFGTVFQGEFQRG